LSYGRIFRVSYNRRGPSSVNLILPPLTI